MDNTLLLNWGDQEVDKEMESMLDKLVDWKSLGERHFIHRVEKARLGGNVGLSMGLEGPASYTYGTHMGRYYLIGADSGVGKTTMADFMFLLKAVESARTLGRKLYVFYCSFEISFQEKIARWVSYFINLEFGVNLPADYIVGHIAGNMVSDEDMNMIRRAYLRVEQLIKEANIVVVEESIHPTKIFHDLIDGHFEKIGTVLRKTAHDPKKKGAIYGWHPKPGEENSMTMLFIDHAGLLASEQGFDTKQTIDLMSRYYVTMRNIFGLTGIMIQQFNTDITSAFRMSKKGDGLVTPQRVDFGDSRYTFRDANVVFGLIKPSIYDIPTYHKYDITKLKHFFVAMHLMKNRHGPSQRVFPIFLNGMAGVAEDLPVQPRVDFVMDPWYAKAARTEGDELFFRMKKQ
jgi:hypothetical protein